MGADSRSWTGHFPGRLCFCPGGLQIPLLIMKDMNGYDMKKMRDVHYSGPRAPMNCTPLIHLSPEATSDRKSLTKSAHLGSLVPLPQLAKGLDDATVWKAFIGRTTQAPGSEEIVKSAFLSENVLEAHSTWKRKNKMNKSLSWNWLSREAVSRKIRDSKGAELVRQLPHGPYHAALVRDHRQKEEPAMRQRGRKRLATIQTSIKASLSTSYILLKYLI